ncbi:late competence development ComFB family protein [Thalassolituus alkanivorans]|jgi:hypothetical protein|uniref:late competence development ComFB family protein n=1 Tax=Thalassolituus alkanivorans TaxID=2881055 RepID=UPI001E62ECB0|nr:late competence development ComFB family protein [Thalassolituus alkanivorans]MCB2388112.1 late competence development ComFB family protein [Thalassolituus alkanivorans]MCB2424651.1 late competence development ComFB family protein [Thalassolituus alkanivorans]
MSINNHIRNYYEQLVAEEILRRLHGQSPAVSIEHMADIACVALNRLPPRYIRFEVDMAFFMTPDELVQTNNRVIEAVTEAIAFVEKHRREEDE